MVGQECFRVCNVSAGPGIKILPKGGLPFCSSWWVGDGYDCLLVLLLLFILEWVLQLTVIMGRHTGSALSLYRGKCSEKKSPKLRGGGNE